MTSRQKEACWAVALGVAAILAAFFYAVYSIFAVPAAVILSYCAGRRLVSLRSAIWSLAVATAFNLTLITARDPGNSLSMWVSAVLAEFAFAVLPWWVGRYRRLRADQRVREQQVIAEHARLRERASIAADMHDALGHELAMIALAGGALELDKTLTDEQRRTATDLRTHAVSAVDHLREAIGVLSDAAGPAARHPANEDVGELVARAQRAGVDVSLHRTPSESALTQAPARACYRVVQEAITNATKHAPAAPIDVTVDESSDPIRVSVANYVPGRSAASRDTGSNFGGQGLVGLDERVRSAGGTFSAGVDGSRFTVTARIPRSVDTPAGSGTDDLPAQVIVNSKKATRRQQLQSAILPAGLAGILLITAIVLQAVTVSMTALDPGDYDRLRVGQSRQEIAAVLPSSVIHQAPAMYRVPGAPSSATCGFYQARTGIFDLSTDMYRLCFRDDVLVAKDHIDEKDT